MGGMWGRVNRCRLRFACACAREGDVALAGGWRLMVVPKFFLWLKYLLIDYYFSD